MEQACAHEIDTTEPSCSLEVRMVAGRLKFFIHEWTSITKNKFVLNCVQGYKIRFSAQPYQTTFPTVSLMRGPETFEDVRKAINNLCQLGAIRQCAPEEPQFISSYFLTPK